MTISPVPDCEDALRIGILSDTHDAFERTQKAVDVFIDRNVSVIIHCGDIISERIIGICSQLPLYFVFGNHDADMVGILSNAATKYNATCLGWGGELELAGKRIAVVHGHLTMDLKPLLEEDPDYLLCGHFHESLDWVDGKTRRIIPGALFRAEKYEIAVLELVTGSLEFIEIKD